MRMRVGQQIELSNGRTLCQRCREHGADSSSVVLIRVHDDDVLKGRLVRQGDPEQRLNMKIRRREREPD